MLLMKLTSIPHLLLVELRRLKRVSAPVMREDHNNMRPQLNLDSVDLKRGLALVVNLVSAKVPKIRCY